jgi:hypothetical protein
MGDVARAADPYLVKASRTERRIGTMPLFMDIHRNVEGLTAEA